MTVEFWKEGYMKISDTKPFIIWILIILEFLLALGAIVSGLMLMITPDGSSMQMPLSVMQGSPFANFFFPGLILFLFIGIYPTGIAYGVLKKPLWTLPEKINPFKRYHWSWAGSLASGLIVWIWLSVELIWVGYSLLHTVFYIWGGLILLLAFLPAARRYLLKK